jgi:hypothetical protein
MDSPVYTYFLAYAGRDQARAERLYDALASPELPCFLASRCLAGGDDWPRAVAQAQRRSRATVALVSDAYDAAYWLREEVLAALDLRQLDASRPRLIPVYLDGLPADPLDVPYGLRGLHALDARRLGDDGVVGELRRLAARLTDAPPAPETHALHAPLPDRERIYDALVTLFDSQLEEVMLRCGAPRAHLAPETAPRARRALDLVLWAEQGGRAHVPALLDALRRAAPHVALT